MTTEINTSIISAEEACKITQAAFVKLTNNTIKMISEQIANSANNSKSNAKVKVPQDIVEYAYENLVKLGYTVNVTEKYQDYSVLMISW